MSANPPGNGGEDLPRRGPGRPDERDDGDADVTERELAETELAEPELEEAELEADHPVPPGGADRTDQPDMVRERARSERRDLDLERGEPIFGGGNRAGPRALTRHARPLHEWTSRPRIL